MKRIQRRFITSACLLGAFVLWTVAVCLVDVQAIGPQGSSVGFAGINRFVHDLTGVHLSLYHVTDWLGLVPIGVCMGFGVLGLAQWIRRKSLLKVDFNILALGGFYLVTIAAYLFFECVVIHYRPVLINGCLEASYPSSTVLLVTCVMPSAMMQLHRRIRSRMLKRIVLFAIALYTAFMVIGRFVSGVHWLTDMIGGALLSAGLVKTYDAVCSWKTNRFHGKDGKRAY